MPDKIEIKIAEAEWLYDNEKPMTMQIFKLNYDFWFDIDEGYHNAGVKKRLNQNREQYVILNNCPNFKDRKDFPYYTSLNLEDAKSYAEKTVKQKLNWKS
jgi:hypothetical protein